MDMSNTIGGTLEELLRHHPELAESCTDALLKELQLILDIMDSYEGLTMEDGLTNHPEAPKTNFTSLLHFAKSVFNVFEAILMKKEHINIFLSKGGINLLTQLLRLSHKPARYVVASFSCSTDPSTHSLGHYPIVKVRFSTLDRHNSFRPLQNLLGKLLIRNRNFSSMTCWHRLIPL